MTTPYQTPALPVTSRRQGSANWSDVYGNTPGGSKTAQGGTQGVAKTLNDATVDAAAPLSMTLRPGFMGTPAGALLIVVAALVTLSIFDAGGVTGGVDFRARASGRAG